MPDPKNKPVFGPDFLWGASTSAHQVEGGNHNQWSVWELTHAAELSKSAPARLSWLTNWPEIEKQARDPNNYISGRGVEHFERYKEDFDLVKKLNLNALRFSVEWSRIEPDEGIWDESAVEHYRNYIKELKKRGIEPVLNIWHWTNPLWFETLGGFKVGANLKYFDRFVAKLADEFASELKWVITVNEPNDYSLFGYLTKDTSSGEQWPPGERSFASMLRVYWNLIRAHRRAYKILKSVNPNLQVGTAVSLANIQAKRARDLLDKAATKIMRMAWNWSFIGRTRRQQDFIGINYYFTDYYTGLLKRQNPPLPVNDLGWYMEPEGLYPLLLRAHRIFKNKPILVSENGVADSHDQYRRWWIEETIVAMERAMSEGVDVRGYFHWSLLDNFEWQVGWWAKFGLVAVDRKTMKRTVRDSAKWFAGYIASLR